MKKQICLNILTELLAYSSKYVKTFIPMYKSNSKILVIGNLLPTLPKLENLKTCAVTVV